MTVRPPDDRESGGETRRAFLATASFGLGTALAGCSSDDAGSTPSTAEATATVRIRNRDAVARSYEVTARHGDGLTNEFSGVLPADQDGPVEMVATFRPTDGQHDVSISSDGGQTGRTWDPSDCPDFLVDAYVEDGDPGFDAECRSE